MFFSNFDMISDLNYIYYKGNKMHSSPIAGVLTILSYCAIIFFLCYFSIDVVYKRNPTSHIEIKNLFLM